MLDIHYIPGIDCTTRVKDNMTPNKLVKVESRN